MRSLFCVAVLFSVSISFAQDLQVKIRMVESDAQSIYSRSLSLLDGIAATSKRTVSQDGSANLSIDKQFRATAQAIYSDGSDYQSSAALVLRSGFSETIGFGTPQIGESKSKAELIVSSVQLIECSKFSADFAVGYGPKKSAIDFAYRTLADCKKIVEESKK